MGEGSEIQQGGRRVSDNLYTPRVYNYKKKKKKKKQSGVREADIRANSRKSLYTFLGRIATVSPKVSRAEAERFVALRAVSRMKA